MVDLELLKKTITERGVTITALARNIGVDRATLYSRLAGKGDFTVTEMNGIVKFLRLTNSESEAIFFADKVE